MSRKGAKVQRSDRGSAVAKTMADSSRRVASGEEDLEDLRDLNDAIVRNAGKPGIPWAKVNPYLLGGITVTQRNYQDLVGGRVIDENRATWGPHLGLGLEFNLSQQTSLSLDARYLAALNLQPDDAARSGAVQGNLGLNFYF